MAGKPTITLKQLRESNACDEQCKLFRQFFGNSVVVTIKRCRLYAPSFDFEWAAMKLLKRETLIEFYYQTDAWRRVYNQRVLGRIASVQNCGLLFLEKRAEIFARLYIAEWKNKGGAK